MPYGHIHHRGAHRRPGLPCDTFSSVLGAWEDTAGGQRRSHRQQPGRTPLGDERALLPHLTSAMASPPFSVKVLSLRLMTRSRGLMAKAWERAVMPGWLIPFCGMWTSSRVPMICVGDREKKIGPSASYSQWVGEQPQSRCPREGVSAGFSGDLLHGLRKAEAGPPPEPKSERLCDLPQVPQL